MESGVGIAQKLAQQGAKVVINYRRSAEEAGGCCEINRRRWGRKLSLSRLMSVLRKMPSVLVKEAIAAFGDLHILVNNAGVTRDMLIMLMKDEDWDLVIQSNLTSVYNCSKAVARHIACESDMVAS